MCLVQNPRTPSAPPRDRLTTVAGAAPCCQERIRRAASVSYAGQDAPIDRIDPWRTDPRGPGSILTRWVARDDTDDTRIESIRSDEYSSPFVHNVMIGSCVGYQWARLFCLRASVSDGTRRRSIAMSLLPTRTRTRVANAEFRCSKEAFAGATNHVGSRAGAVIRRSRLRLSPPFRA